MTIGKKKENEKMTLPIGEKILVIRKKMSVYGFSVRERIANSTYYYNNSFHLMTINNFTNQIWK